MVGLKLKFQFICILWKVKVQINIWHWSTSFFADIFSGKFKFRGCAIKFRLCSEVIILYHAIVTFFLSKTNLQCNADTEVFGDGNLGPPLSSVYIRWRWNNYCCTYRWSLLPQYNYYTSLFFKVNVDQCKLVHGRKIILPSSLKKKKYLSSKKFLKKVFQR